MGFVRQRDIIQQKKRVAELVRKCEDVNCIENRNALREAKESLKDMMKENRLYEKMFL